MPDLMHADLGDDDITGTKIPDLVARSPQLVDVLRHMLGHGVDPNERLRSGLSLLHSAAHANNVPAIDLLVARGADRVAADEEGRCPIDWTIYMDRREAFQRLLDHGATPGLFAAVAHGRLDLAEELVRVRSPALARLTFPDVLHKAVREENSRAVALILGEHPELNGLAITVAASGCFTLNILRFLLDHGIDASARNDEGQTPLHKAAFVNSTAAIGLLLSRGADLEAADDEGYTPIDRTCEQSTEAFDLLLERGATPGVFSAVAHRRKELLERLLEQGPSHRVPDSSFLFVCAQGREDYEGIVELLERHGFES